MHAGGAAGDYAWQLEKQEELRRMQAEREHARATTHAMDPGASTAIDALHSGASGTAGSGASGTAGALYADEVTVLKTLAVSICTYVCIYEYMNI